MDPRRVLVVFSNRTGSTAGTAVLIAAELRAAGRLVDLRPAAEVVDVAAYQAVIVGSGVFVMARASDGGGFLARFAPALASRPVWLFCVGPIGRSPAQSQNGRDGKDRECAAALVGRMIGARGWAAFGTSGMGSGIDPVMSLLPADPAEIREWARTIAAELAAPHASGADCHSSRVPHRRRLAVAG